MQHSKYLARFQTSAPPCRTLQANRSAEIRYQPEEADPEKKVVAALERHVQYLEKQLRESQQQGRETAEWLRTARAAREEEARTWRQKCQEAERLRTAAEEQLSLKEAELERWQLRQKMESIGGELQRQKQSQTSLKHRSPRGKFSGSPTHAFHQQEPIDELRCSQQLIRNPMSGVLIDEWQRFREEKELADKQVAVLEGKLTNLRREVVRQDRELASLKAAHAEKEKELRLANCELMQTRERIRQLHRHNASSSRNAHKWEEMADEGVGDGKEEEPCSSNSTTATDVQFRPRRTALSLRIVEVCV